MQIKLYLSVLILLSFLLLSCKDDDDVIIDSGSANNIPAVGNATDAFGFSVNAKDYNLQQDYQVVFNNSRISFGLTIANHSAGNGTLLILSKNDSLLYSTKLDNMVLGQDVELKDIPGKVKIDFSNYTGQVAIGIGCNK